MNNVERNKETVVSLAESEPGFAEWRDSRPTRNARSLHSYSVAIGAVRAFANANGYTKPFRKMSSTEAARLSRMMKDKGMSGLQFYCLKSFLSEQPKLAKCFRVSMRQKRIAPEDIPTVAEVNAILEAAPNIRDLALLSVLFDTGSRIAEVCALRLKDVSQKTVSNGHGDGTFAFVWFPKMKVTGTERTVMLSLEASQNLLRWLRSYPKDIAGDGERPLFPSRAGGHYGDFLAPASWQGRLKDISRLAGLSEDRVVRMHPHAARHYCATKLLRENWTEAKVKQRMGWNPASSLLARYGHLVSSDANDELLRRSGFEPEKAVVQPMAVPTREIPAMPPEVTNLNNAGVKQVVQSELASLLNEALAPTLALAQSLSPKEQAKVAEFIKHLNESRAQERLARKA